MAKFNIKKKYYWIAAAVLLVILIGWRIAASRGKSTYSIAYQVAPQDVKQTVLATGTVTSQSNLNLSFKGSGTLKKLDVSVSDHVRQGQTLAMLDESDAAAAITQAKAALLSAQANYDKIVNGITSQDLDVAKAAVQSAQVTLNNAKITYNNSVAQQQVAVNNAFSAMMNAGLSATPSSTNLSTAAVTISGTYNAQTQGSYTINIYASGNGPAYSVSGLETMVATTITRGSPQPVGSHGFFITFSTSGSINASDVWTISVPNLQAATYLTSYNAYQTALQSQTQTLASAQGSVDAAQAALDQANAQLAQKQANARPEDIQTAQAQIEQAQGQLQAANNTYANNIISAPIDGVITSVDTKLGEMVTPQKEVIVMLDQNSLHVESDISESSITLLQPGQSIDMTMDAFGPDKHFSGEVISIDPASTVVQGVIDYRVVSSIPNDPAIKSGMTVNIVIQISDKANVLAVPNRLIKSNGSQKFVTILKNNKAVDVNIQTGAVGDSFTEVSSGLNLGDKIVTTGT
jgi:HlyD family secretion protein